MMVPAGTLLWLRLLIVKSPVFVYVAVLYLSN